MKRRSIKREQTSILLCIGLLLAPVREAEAAGELDPSFGGAGQVTTEIGAGPDVINALVLQPDGRIVGAGRIREGGIPRFGLVRYDPDGSLDETFGDAGVVTTTIGPLGDHALGLVLQPDGKLVVAGSSEDAEGRVFALARYLPSGSLDADFGNGGIVTTDFGGSSDSAFGLVLQPDGKLVAAGSSNAGGPAEFALARYLPDGLLDPSFGGGGLVRTAVGTQNANALTLARQSDGKLVAAGWALSGAQTSFALARYLSDGTLDAAFGTAGTVVTASASPALATALVVQPDGNVLAGGLALLGTRTDFILARYTAAGMPDTTFGGDGIVTTSLRGVADELFDLVLQPDGKAVAVGQSQGPASTDYAVVRYQENGAVDQGFGTGGFVITPFGSDDAAAFSAMVQPAGRLVAAGRVGNHFALARYLLTNCGNGIVEAGEGCDDGNPVDGDGCATSCLPEACTEAPPGLIAWWPADGSPLDIAGARDGTLLGGATYLPGRAVAAFSLDGVDDHVEIPSDPVWDFAGETFTIDLWVLFSRTPANHAFVARNAAFSGECSAADGWAFGVRDEQLVFRVSAAGEEPVDVVTAAWSPLPGQWHHVAVTRDGPSYALHIDGVLSGSSSDATALPAPDAPLLIGRSGACPPDEDFLPALVDEVEIFDRALDAAEIQAIVAAGSGGKCKVCGDGVVTAGEDCDGGGETATCNSDCTVAECGDGTVNLTAGEECDDEGESADCNANCTLVECGDGIVNVTAGEDCEDVESACCTAACRFEVAGAQCADDDGDLCTISACDGAGQCVGVPPDACLSAGRSVLILKNRGGTKDKLVWKWLRGQATTLTAFGNPFVTASNALCFYAGDDPAPVGRAEVPPSAVRWRRTGSSGLKYKDVARAADGIDTIVLKSGLPGKSKVLVKGMGLNLPDIDLPVALPLTVRLVNNETGACWQASYSGGDVKKNRADQFQGKGP